MNIYYVYAYLRNKNSSTARAGTPYYIGKGKGARAYANHLSVPVPLDKQYIQIIQENLTEHEAHQLESSLIKKYGRKDLSSGILLNRTNGGEGTSGPKTEEHKRKIGNANKGKNITAYQRQQISKKLTGRKRSAESIEKMIQTVKAQNRSVMHSAETRKKISESRKGKNTGPQSADHIANKIQSRIGKPLLKQVCRLVDRKELSMSHYTQWVNRLKY